MSEEVHSGKLWFYKSKFHSSARLMLSSNSLKWLLWTGWFWISIQLMNAWFYFHTVGLILTLLRASLQPRAHFSQLSLRLRLTQAADFILSRSPSHILGVRNRPTDLYQSSASSLLVQTRIADALSSKPRCSVFSQQQRGAGLLMGFHLPHVRAQWPFPLPTLCCFSSH